MKKILLMALIAIGLNADGQDTTLNKLEYFIDKDPGPGNGKSVPVTPSENVSVAFDVDLSGFTPGYHLFYLRTRDDLGRWSLTARRNIEVLPGVANPVETGEYFIDKDPGYGNGKPISIAKTGDEISETFAVSIAGLSIGYHLLYGRMRNNNGSWSQTFRRNIEVVDDADKLLVDGEYFFRKDNGFGNGSPVKFTAPATEGSFAFNIPAAQIPEGADTIFVRLRQDGQSLWSLTRWAIVSTALPLTWLDFTAQRTKDIVSLNWQTTNEINTSVFNVQRSTDGLHFGNVGSVPANNRAGINNYSLDDKIDGVYANQLFYRLQQMDINGEAQFSKIIFVTVDRPVITIKFYPNPFTSHITLVTEDPSDLKGSTLIVTDLTGKTLVKQKLTTSGQQRIDLSGLAKGIYLIQINKSTGNEVYKIVKE